MRATPPLASSSVSATTPEELGVAAAPLALPETDYDDNDTDTDTTQKDPRNERRPGAWRENREQCRANERNGCRRRAFISRGCRTSDESAAPVFRDAPWVVDASSA